MSLQQRASQCTPVYVCVCVLGWKRLVHFHQSGVHVNAFTKKIRSCGKSWCMLFFVLWGVGEGGGGGGGGLMRYVSDSVCVCVCICVCV